MLKMPTTNHKAVSLALFPDAMPEMNKLMARDFGVNEANTLAQKVVACMDPPVNPTKRGPKPAQNAEQTELFCMKALSVVRTNRDMDGAFEAQVFSLRCCFDSVFCSFTPTSQNLENSTPALPGRRKFKSSSSPQTI